jgi:NTE family protein
MSANPRPLVGLALSGGTAKSLAHIGVLQALEEADIRVDCLAGTSGGAIVGAVYAAGFSIEQLTEVAGKLRWRHLARLTFPKLGLLNNSGVRSFLTDLLGDVTFADLRIPLAIVGTDFLAGKKVVFRDGKVAEAAMISSSIPNVFEPVELDGTLYVDGGLVEYLPVETVREFNPRVVIAVNLGHREEPSSRPGNLLHVAMQVVGIAARQNALISETRADIVIRPPAASFPSFDLMASSRLIEVGYAETKKRVPEIQALLEKVSHPSWLSRLKFWGRSQPSGW